MNAVWIWVFGPWWVSRVAAWGWIGMCVCIYPYGPPGASWSRNHVPWVRPRPARRAAQVFISLEEGVDCFVVCDCAWNGVSLEPEASIDPKRLPQARAAARTASKRPACILDAQRETTQVPDARWRTGARTRPLASARSTPNPHGFGLPVGMRCEARASLLCAAAGTHDGVRVVEGRQGGELRRACAEDLSSTREDMRPRVFKNSKLLLQNGAAKKHKA